MLDSISLDQLRTFIAAAETGSFSAAGRQLGRAQSVVSQTLANLEGQLGLRLFERSGRYPVLTPNGQALLADARVVAGTMDLFKARSRALAGGLEAELSIVVNVLFPTRLLTDTVTAFQAAFPDTPLRILVEGLGAAIEPVVEGKYAYGISIPMLAMSPELSREHLFSIQYVMVAAPNHPLAANPGPIPANMLAQHVQLVLSERSRVTEGTDYRVFSSKIWRLSDISQKHAFLRAGLGWGGMPLDLVAADLASGALVLLKLQDTAYSTEMAMSAIYRTESPPGPAGRWLIERLKAASQAEPPPSS